MRPWYDTPMKATDPTTDVALESAGCNIP